jgi:hypothetical protein
MSNDALQLYRLLAVAGETVTLFTVAGLKRLLGAQLLLALLRHVELFVRRAQGLAAGWA